MSATISQDADRERDEYIFGAGDDELIRLGFQHRAWARFTYALWDRAGFAPGWRILDLGAGPGYCTIDLAHLVGPGGMVVAVDESEQFLSHLKRKMELEPIDNVETIACDVNELDLPEESLDGAYARWLLCFLPDPLNVLTRIAKALKPGGVFAIQDYSNYSAVDVWPRSEAFRRVIEAVGQSWRTHGGSPNVASHLPELLARVGFDTPDVRPLVQMGGPGSVVWNWPTTFFRTFVHTLVEEGHLTDAQRRDFENDWAERTKNPNAVFTTPPMLDIVAVKR